MLPAIEGPYRWAPGPCPCRPVINSCLGSCFSHPGIDGSHLPCPHSPRSVDFPTEHFLLLLPTLEQESGSV